MSANYISSGMSLSALSNAKWIGSVIIAVSSLACTCAVMVAVGLRASSIVVMMSRGVYVCGFAIGVNMMY